MKIIRKIALAELRHLFFSPVAWFVVVIFYILAAVPFFDWMEKMTLTLDAGKELMSVFLGWQDGIYKSMRSEGFGQLLRHLYMFLPLLTMTIISREQVSGSIKLLYAAPVRTRDIILGKYLGLVAFNMVLLAGSALLLFTGFLVSENIPLLAFISVLLGWFFLVNTYAAIGLFVNCFTNYQIVAAVLTFVVFYVMQALSGIGQQYDLIRDITYYLSFGNKASNLFFGLISSGDILYYILIISLFLVFAMIKMKSMRESKKWYVIFSRYALALLVTIIVGYSTSRPGHMWYWDASPNKDNTLRPAVQAVLGKLDGSPLKVTLYTNLLDPSFQLPQLRNKYIWDFWAYYMRFYPNIEFDYVHYYAIKAGDNRLYKQYPGKNIEELAAIMAEYHGVRKSLFKKGSELPNVNALMKEDLKTLMEVEYKGKKTFLRTTQGGVQGPQPINVAGALMRLIRDTAVKVTFLTGHYERDAYSYAKKQFGHNTSLKFSKHSLIDRGVDIDTISVKDSDVPGDVQLLVVADPRLAYSAEELQRIERYVRQGGNAMFLVEPGKQEILNPVLEKIGITAEDGILVQPAKHRAAHAFINELTRTGNFMSKEFTQFQTHGVNGGSTNHEGVASLSVAAVDGFKVDTIIKKTGDSSVWLDRSRFIADSAAPVFDTADGDIRKSEYIVAVKLTRMAGDKEQRIIVSGDADYMTFKAIGPNPRDYDFNHNFYSWLLNNEYPIFTGDPVRADLLLKVDHAQAQSMTSIYVYVFPAMMILFAAIMLLRRNRQ